VRKVFTGLMTVLMVTVAVQFFLAASGAFDPAPPDESFGLHRGLGFLILLLALVAIAVGALARMPGHVVGRTGLVLGLVVLQPVIAGVARAVADSDGGSTAGQMVFGLHGVNGLLIMALVATSLRRSRAVAPGSDDQREGLASPASGTAEAGS
jgi:hypothetical protein